VTAINRELEAFSYSVSHDLRAPLLSFNGLNQSLLEDYGNALDPRAKDYLQRMRLASDRMTSVFDGLQTLFRLTSGEIHANRWISAPWPQSGGRDARRQSRAQG